MIQSAFVCLCTNNEQLVFSNIKFLLFFAAIFSSFFSFFLLFFAVFFFFRRNGRRAKKRRETEEKNALKADNVDALQPLISLYRALCINSLSIIIIMIHVLCIGAVCGEFIYTYIRNFHCRNKCTFVSLSFDSCIFVYILDKEITMRTKFCLHK